MFREDLLSAILALFSIFSVVLCDWNPKPPQAQPVCTSSACAARGQEYVANMLRSVNPCEDFFRFACGSWEKNHPIPPYTKWDVVHRLNEDTLITLKKLLDTMRPHTAQTEPAYARLKWTYDACIKLPYFGKFGPKEITEKIKKIGRHPRKKVWDLHSEYLRLTGESAFFDIEVGNFDSKIDMPMLQFSEPLTPYGSIYHDETWKSSDEKSYSAALFDMLSSLGLGDSPDIMKRRIKSVIQFRHSLVKILSKIYNRDEYDDDEAIHTSPRELEKLFVRTAKSNRGTANKIQIPWEKTAKILLDEASATAVLKKDIIVLHSRNYFVELAVLLEKSTEQDIADHMEIYFIERHLKRTEKVQQLLKKSWQDAPPSIETMRFDEPRWMTCIKKSNLNAELAKLFIGKWLKTEHKDQVGTIMTALKNVINAQMTKSTWLDKESRELITRRMNEIEGVVGDPPKHLERYGPAKTIYPAAFLDSGYDIIYVHAAMLQSPIFDPRLPAFYNIATTGFMLGHEYYHVIGDCGIYPITNLRSVILWPELTQKKCKERKQCFITEYNKYTKTEFQRRYKLSPKIDTTNSFIENYADVMGMETALILHERLKENYGGKCEILPGFQGYSCDQMFFIAFANMWCGAPKAKRALWDLTEDLHSINPVRVNGALSSSETFAKAFQCGKRDTMNPTTKCNLWK